jgi:hypothetical protein
MEPVRGGGHGAGKGWRADLHSSTLSLVLGSYQSSSVHISADGFQHALTSSSTHSE